MSTKNSLNRVQMLIAAMQMHLPSPAAHELFNLKAALSGLLESAFVDGLNKGVTLAVVDLNAQGMLVLPADPAATAAPTPDTVAPLPIETLDGIVEDIQKGLLFWILGAPEKLQTPAKNPTFN